MGVSQNWGYHFGGPCNKDYSILGSILGSPYFGKLPNQVIAIIYHDMVTNFKFLNRNPANRIPLQDVACWGRSILGPEVQTGRISI